MLSSHYNPFTTRLATATKSLETMRTEAAEANTRLAWYENFDVEANLRARYNANAALNAAESELSLLQPRLEQQTLTVLNLRKEASVGLNPFRFFSSERAVAERHMHKETAALDSMKKRRCELESECTRQRDLTTHLQEVLARYRAYLPLEERARISGLNFEITNLTPQVDDLERNKARADELLSQPLADLGTCLHQRAGLIKEMDWAEELDRALSHATNSYERARIHQECEDRFGEGSPKKLLHKAKDQLKRIEREIEKLETRLETLAKRLSHQVRTLVIDGNNLCYMNSQFCGLAALDALVPELAKDYRVIIIFDAGIRSLMKMNDVKIARRFGQTVTVHVVATARAADETLLDIASKDSQSFVISNDRFCDFKDKAAVVEERLIRHEIVADMVYLHDIGISVNFAPEFT